MRTTRLGRRATAWCLQRAGPRRPAMLAAVAADALQLWLPENLSAEPGRL